MILIVAAFQSNDPFPPWGSEKSFLNATWYLWLVLSWPAGCMRCGSIRRCFDDLIFHVLKWPVELCTLFLHLLYVQPIPRVARWRGQIVVHFIFSSAWSNNAARDRTRFISFWSPEKFSVDQCFEIFYVHDRKGIRKIWVWRFLSLAAKPQELPTKFNEQHASIFTRFVKWLVRLFPFLQSTRLIAFPAPKIGSQAYFFPWDWWVGFF